MSHFKPRIVCYCIIFIFSLLLNDAYAGTVVSGANTELVDKIYKGTYHFQFKKVDSLILANDPAYKNNLEYNLALVNYYWWRLISGEKNDRFSTLVSERIEKIKAIYSKKKPIPENDQLFLLISIYSYSARVSLLDYSYYSALTDLSRYYSLLTKSFGHEEAYKSFYLTSGLYYYFAGFARIKMPYLAPILHYYTPGNIEKGIQYITKAEASGDWKISQEAKYFLMKINFDINENYTESAKYCKQLMAMYPENLLFQFYMLRISLAVNQETYAKGRLAIMERTAKSNNQLTADEKTFYIKQAKSELESFHKKKK